jgi:hypothetical protein
MLIIDRRFPAVRSQQSGKVVSERLGREDIEITFKIYAHTADDADRGGTKDAPDRHRKEGKNEVEG